MKLKFERPSPALGTIKHVPVGCAFTWGTGVHWYLRVSEDRCMAIPGCRSYSISELVDNIRERTDVICADVTMVVHHEQ